MNKLFENRRVAFIKAGCPHCRVVCEFIERMNTKLPIDKRIRVIDCSREQYGINNVLMLLYQKHVTGYPTIFLGQIKIDGISTKIGIIAFLESYLNKEFIIPEYNQFMFNKECSIIKKGLFRGTVTCK